MKGETFVINGDPWTVVDVAPAAELAEMVAALLEDEGFVTMTRGPGFGSDALTHLGTHAIGTSYVLVPKRDAERAQKIIEATVTDYEGGDLDALLEEIAASGLTAEAYLDRVELGEPSEDDADDEA